LIGSELGDSEMKTVTLEVATLDGLIIFPYDAIRVDVMLHAA
jgi:hypothetical protein